MTAIVKRTSASAEVKTAKISDEEARLTVLAPAGDIQAVKVSHLSTHDGSAERESRRAGFRL